MNDNIGVFNDIMTHYEAEQLIQTIQPSDIQEYGSDTWYKQNGIIQRLNIQAHLNAIMKNQEFIMETFVTYDKLKVVVYELLVSEQWKSNILNNPIKEVQFKQKVAKLNSYRTYIPVYHEAALLNLLENLMFHRDTVESIDNYLIELIDYCYRKLIWLQNHTHKVRLDQQKQQKQQGEQQQGEQQQQQYNKQQHLQQRVQEIMRQNDNKTEVDQYDEQIQEIEFQISMMCITVIRYISDYGKYLGISIIHHLVQEKDIFCILVPLMEDKPWERVNSKGMKEVYQDNKWINDKQDGKLNKIEAQIWLTVYNLFMDGDVRKKYDLNDYRKNNLLRLRKFMKEQLIDQIPMLAQLFRSLEELSLMQTNSISLNNPFVIQQMPQIVNGILKNRNYKEIQQLQLNQYFNETVESRKKDLNRMMEMFGGNIYDGLVDGFHCNLCGQIATKRCKGCKVIWYCSQECQKSDWKKHKGDCKQKQKQEQKQEQEQEQKQEQEQEQEQKQEQKQEQQQEQKQEQKQKQMTQEQVNKKDEQQPDYIDEQQPDYIDELD